ncbi:hypothetical protein DVH24_039744 [Malus domestica]|uniref:Uncharacterized protein n=1 Tax=Malus domestica TaxID=3750 RepID=A0A498I9J4_MALDO|nr:hypothetical protein DVH24_039744 [Malus domestica]
MEVAAEVGQRSEEVSLRLPGGFLCTPRSVQSFGKHSEKKWKCDKCSKKYTVQSNWKAYSKICGTRKYKCDCGTLSSMRDSFITHMAFFSRLLSSLIRFISDEEQVIQPHAGVDEENQP